MLLNMAKEATHIRINRINGYYVDPWPFLRMGISQIGFPSFFVCQPICIKGLSPFSLCPPLQLLSSIQGRGSGTISSEDLNV